MTHMRTLDEILSAMQYRSTASDAIVARAYEIAKISHDGQKRYSGEPYFIHPAEVGYTLAQVGMDPDGIAAGLLHDTVEDAGMSEDEVIKEFGPDVLHLVQGVTKLGTLRYRGLERHTESLRKLFAATAKDIRVLIIKLMDRLHNVRTLEHVPREDKRLRIAQETLEIYAPIADRLGMSVIKTQLEDAAFPWAYPKEYEKTRSLFKERSSENEERLERLEKTLKKELFAAGIRAFRTEARIKGVYSLFLKLERKHWDLDKIHDLLALRIILPSLADCYNALGVVHAHWRPVPGKIKDYIAFPKPNGYQSIHTTVYTGDGGAIEIQFRTEEQHLEAQYGIASHLAYKEMQTGSAENKKSGIQWIKQFFPRWRKDIETTIYSDFSKSENVPPWIKDLAQAHDTEESTEYLDTIKNDFFSHRVFVFTPRSDVIDLPLGATPIDFAYAIHSDVGNHMSGARVNGKLVSLDTQLRNGDIVEITTRPGAKPSRKWLEFAKTSMARKHIKSGMNERNPSHFKL